MKTKIYSILLAATLLISGCSGSQQYQKSEKNDAIVNKLIGAGATFPFPYYSKLFNVYNIENGIQVNYQSIGSCGGIKQLQAKTVDFGASDAPMSDKELPASPTNIVHIPTCLGAVVVTSNLGGNPTLKFTPDVLADIFLRIAKAIRSLYLQPHLGNAS